ncbi:GGDEF domain-containing protein [Pseudomonas sp. BMS12]|uniref:GGDEF domain-containing protein n=1 Tax=Pseudomonas sp. BMS12 TaxID=1796033 RepID=UPI00083A8055|nr:diguanylate cyclase [Pseudomonas sp. BMS12]
MRPENFRSVNSQELDFERIKILFNNVKFGYLGVATSLGLLYFVAQRYAGLEIALAWLLAVCTANIPRIVVSVLFELRMRAGAISPANIRPWERFMTLAGTVAYVGFASVIFLPYGNETPVAIALCAFAFMIMAAGGVLVLSTSLAQIIVYLTLVMLAIISRFFLLDDALFALVALFLLVGYLHLLRLLVVQSRILIENISLKIENRQFALKDPLTKLANRRALYAYLEKLIPAAQRNGEPFSVIILDVDHFKHYNDSKGHSAGDELLINLAAVLLECCREEDLVVRYGGEEFLLVLPHTPIEGARAIAERIRQTVKARLVATISAGLAEYCEGVEFESLVGRADKALYVAKNNGRDQCVVHE